MSLFRVHDYKPRPQPGGYISSSSYSSPMQEETSLFFQLPV